MSVASRCHLEKRVGYISAPHCPINQHFQYSFIALLQLWFIQFQWHYGPVPFYGVAAL